MASLPLQVSNLARLSKFKVARKVAVELYLSLMAVSIRNRSSQMGEAPSIAGGVDLPPYSEDPKDSDFLTSSQMAMSSPPEAGFSLPTPSRTPSVYSYVSNDTSELTEDPLISRLRQYAVSIKSRLDLGEPALLSQWPSAPGVDPAQYSWRSMADEGEDEFDSRRRRDEARRRRRTEKFLSRERTKESQASSQPTAIRSGSQPELGQHAASSQSVSNVPMTQPDRGAFGARSSKLGKKKQGKRRAAGF
jgi:RNA polymerase I-specific transcription initiation factor RRN6